MRHALAVLCMLVLLHPGQPSAEPARQPAVPRVERAAQPGAQVSLPGVPRLRRPATEQAAGAEAHEEKEGGAAQGGEPAGAQGLSPFAVRSPTTEGIGLAAGAGPGWSQRGGQSAHDASVFSCVVEDQDEDADALLEDRNRPTDGLGPPLKRRKSEGHADVGHQEDAGPGGGCTAASEEGDVHGEADENEHAYAAEGSSEPKEGYDTLRVVDEVVDEAHEESEGEEGQAESAEGAAEHAGEAEAASDEEPFRPWREQRWPLDLNAVLRLYNSINETLSLEPGEYQLDALVRVEDVARIDHAPPPDDELRRLVNESVAKARVAAAASAEAEIVEEVAQNGETVLVHQRVASSAGVVIKLWGPWSMGARSSGSMRHIGTVQQTDTAEDPTLEVEGSWVFEWCTLRSCGGTAMLVHSLGDVAVRSCAVGSMPGQAPAEYGITTTDTAACLVEKSTLQSCRVVGARCLLQANCTLVDCALERCSVEGVRMVRSNDCKESGG